MTEQIRVPDVGEAEDVEVIEVLVAVGDVVAVDDSLVVLESDKASMEIPTPTAGTIVKLHVKEGDKVVEGGVIVELEVAGGDAIEPAVVKEDAPQEQTVTPIADPAASRKSEPTATTSATASATEQTVTVPDVGEAADITVTEILVSVGDEIEADDSLVVLESDKASMEIPAPMSGKVTEIIVALGSEVNEGDRLIKMLVVGANAEPVASAAKEEAPTSISINVALPPTQKKADSPAAANTEDADAKVHAGPAVRKQAREYGVALSEVKGSGRQGRIVKEDIQEFVKQRLAAPAAVQSSGSGIPAMPIVDFSKFGEIELSPMSRIKQASAKNLHRSWLNVPHVTQFDEADITELEAFRKQQNVELKAQGAKLTPLAFLVKACVHALQTYPQFNSSLEADYKNLILKKYYNVGVAVETPDGLVVPVIKNADQKGIVQLAAETSELAAKARDKKLPMDAMQGATFTISSLGGIGGTKFTPIVNAPEVAILGVSRSKVAPVWDGKEFGPRTILPLSLSYDHRAIDGAEAARFTSYLAAVLSDVRRLLL